MRSLRNTLIVAAVGCIVFIGAWIFQFAHEPLSADSSRWGHFGDYLGGTLAPILAFASFVGLIASIRSDRQQLDSMTLLQTAKTNLERAYTGFIDANGQPISDRLVWLTAARLVLSAKSIGGQIKVQSVRAMYVAEEDHWRRKFYDALKPTSRDSPISSPEYFTAGERRLPGYVIDERSIKVLFDFVDWPVTLRDPMDHVERFTDQEIEAMTLGKRGAGEYIRRQRNP